MIDLTVIIAVYAKDHPRYLEKAAESVLCQTRMPDELLFVVDGPVPDSLNQVIAGYEKRGVPQIRSVRLERNCGLGEAMRVAVEQARGRYVARMDADDISLPNRFEKQMACFENDPELAVVGGMIEDFSDDMNHVAGKRVVPLTDKDIKRFMKSRNGMNHVTVMFRKDELLRTGNYQPFHLNEDYYLWVRMIQKGCKLLNVPDVLVKVRAGKEQMDRRGGWPYFKNQYRVFKYMLDSSFISLPRFLLNLCERGTVQLLMPLALRSWVYRHILRK